MERRTELVGIVALGVLGAALFGLYFPDTPGSVPVSHTQSEAAAQAAAFVEERGYNVTGMRRSTTTGSDGDASVYIQQTVPRPSVRETLLEYDVRYWETRYYEPLEQGEIEVAVDPVDGNVVGLVRSIPDEAPGANRSQSAARQRAVEFLREMGHDPATLRPVENATTERARRTDHTFTWENPDRALGNASYRISVTVQGAQIGEYHAFLNVPDEFVHQYEVRQRRGQTLAIVSLALMGLFVLAAIWQGLRFYKEETFDARYGVALGGVVAAVGVLSFGNSLPQLRHAIPTTLAPWQFLLISAIGALVAAGVYGAVTFVAAGSGKRLTEAVLDRPVVDSARALLADPDRGRNAARSLLRGSAIGLALLGFNTAFYVVGTELFGFWLPAGSALNQATLYVPALSALVVAAQASIWEETLFRGFGIPFLKRYAKYTAVAVLVTAVVWGAGHSSYAVLPFWARAVEVTLLGIFLGLAFLRYDLVTTIAAHYTMNATVTAVPLLFASTAWLRLNGALAVGIAAVPVLLAGALWLYHRGSDRGTGPAEPTSSSIE